MAKKVFRSHLADVEAEYGPGPIDQGLADLFDQGLAARTKDHDADYARTHPPGVPSASLARKCARRVWLSINQVTETNPPDAQSLGNFAFGHAIEDAVAKVLAASGAQVLRQLEFSIEHEIPSLPPLLDETTMPTTPASRSVTITGHADLLVVRPDGGLIEVKCTSAENVEWNLKRGNWGSEEHRAQLNLYLHAANEGALSGVKGNFEDGTLVYCVPNAKKGERVFWPWFVPYNRAAALAEMDRLARIALATEMPAIPEGYAPGKYPCSYCPFFSGCWEAAFALAEATKRSRA